ncbi:MAG: DUF1295 domain-containing protein [Chlamydiia bacterium]|nr:DUF1295 domain-containing protein [Chlamydiia bacterium]
MPQNVNDSSFGVWTGILISLLLARALAWAGSQGGYVIGDMGLFELCVSLAFSIQFAAFIPAYWLQTERFYDLVGSLTFLSITACALHFGNSSDPRSVLMALLVCIWALRLGGFLVLRVIKQRGDGRFDSIKTNAGRYLLAWMLQGLWVSTTLGPTLAVLSSKAVTPLSAWGYLGVFVWLFGFAIEVVADEQKRRHRRCSKHFIKSGLWAWCRHPNYFGEVALWTGVAILAAPALQGWQCATLVSPLFVYLLLTRISGVPILEARSDERWGGQEEYEAYKDRTPPLFPWTRSF